MPTVRGVFISKRDIAVFGSIFAILILAPCTLLGCFSSSAAPSGHVDALTKQGSATVSVTGTVQGGGQGQVISTTVKSDYSSSRYILTNASSSTTRYTNETMTYLRIDHGNYSTYERSNSTYFVSSRTVPITTSVATGAAYLPLRANFKKNGTTTISGVKTTKYVAESLSATDGGIDGVNTSTAFGHSVRTVSQGSATVFVDQNGVIRKASWTASYTTSSGATVSAQVSVTVNGVGTTSVKPPLWTRQLR